MNIKQLFFFGGVAALTITIIFMHITKPRSNYESGPLVAIANYGPHSSLEAAIAGVKQKLARCGFVEGKTVRYTVADVGFDTALIPQMLAQLKSQKPAVMVVLSTPIAQCAKGTITDIPLVFTAVTDPIAAGLLTTAAAADGNMTGSSEKQDLSALLDFARTLIPHTQRVGLLYSTGESNDLALVTMMKQAAQAVGMEVVAVPVDQARDVPLRMQQFKGKVDFLYVGSSGAIQPTLPVIAGIADQLSIPVINVNEEAVRDGLVLGCFGVDFVAVGASAGALIAHVLNGVPISQLPPMYPTLQDHKGLVSKKKAAALGIGLPDGLVNVEIVA